ncbi:reverse transcriptase domain-containing protein [Tanacetum coccineum]
MQKHGWTNSTKELSKHGMNFEPLSLADSFPPALFDRLLGEIRAFSQHKNESLTDAWLRMKEMLRNCHGHNLSKDNIIKIFYHGLKEITQEVLNAATGELQSRAKQPTPDLDDDDIPMSHEEEAKFTKTFRSLPSNNQPNPRGNNSKAYQPPKSRNEHVNVVFIRSADLGASINLMPYTLYAKLSLETLKPTKLSIRLANRSFQYLVGIAENMLIEVGKFTFPADFVILEMEEDSKVPLILGRPFLHTIDAVIRVKQKQLNLGVGTERMIFNIDSAIKHSYSKISMLFLTKEAKFSIPSKEPFSKKKSFLSSINS